MASMDFEDYPFHENFKDFEKYWKTERERKKNLNIKQERQSHRSQNSVTSISDALPAKYLKEKCAVSSLNSSSTVKHPKPKKND
ncbi:hypothetical protein NPIL_461561 [Nephila pilipes]|uniref:Uncharacterized protein n=1 Tax=Nephila pilipes TaxID=299642 RepID=A0A8X6UFK2_NEPPI|nr:hypothetical protein NPIL_461561 [Nephila pilipes]